jgi:hypothetical protein
MFLHQVYFTLKQETPASAKAQLLSDCRNILAKIPCVENLWAGERAGTTREVVDKAYSIGLAIVFKDAAAHDIYQSHPEHLEFIARNKAHWEKVRIFDFTE